MEKILQILMFAVLATAATATHKFDLTYSSGLVKKFAKSISGKNAEHITQVNENAQVQWKLEATDNSGTPAGATFTVANPSFVSQDCHGLPGLRFDDGITYCLFQVHFGSIDKKTKDVLRLQLVYDGVSEEGSKTKIVVSTLKAKPTGQVDLSGVIPVEPFTRSQIKEVCEKRTFSGPSSWITAIIEKGLYTFTEYEVSQDVIAAYPTVMSEDILQEVLALSSKCK